MSYMPAHALHVCSALPFQGRSLQKCYICLFFITLDDFENNVAYLASGGLVKNRYDNVIRTLCLRAVISLHIYFTAYIFCIWCVYQGYDLRIGPVCQHNFNNQQHASYCMLPSG